MWSAFLYVCTAVGCMTLIDTRGPYTTEMDCETRVLEMHMEVSEILLEVGYFGPQNNEGECKLDPTSTTMLDTGINRSPISPLLQKPYRARSLPAQHV